MKDILQSYFINNNDEIEFELTTILSSSSQKNSFNEELSEIIHSHTEAIKRILCSEKESNIYYIGLYTNDYIRKKFTEQNKNIFDIKFDMLSDVDFILRFSKKYDFECVNNPVATYRIHNDQLQNKNFQAQADQYFKWYEKLKFTKD